MNKIIYMVKVFFIFSILFLCSGCIDSDIKELSTSTTYVKLSPVDETLTTSPVSSTIASTTTTTSIILSTTTPAVTTSSTMLKSDLTALNLHIPHEIDDNCIGFLIGSLEEVQSASYVSGGWIRPHPGPFSWGYIEKIPGQYDFRHTDELVKSSQKEGVGILATVWPFADWDGEKCHAKECIVSKNDIFYPKNHFGLTMGIPVSRCKPCDMNAYRTFLSKIVERYDGDGIDDMPGLQIPIHYWEILNEPSMQGGEMAFFKNDESEYVNLLKESYSAIKTTCPKCKVVQGGAAGNHKEAKNYWRKVFEFGGGDYFDIANIHYIGVGDLSTLNVNEFKKLMEENSVEKPIWVTEAEFTREKDIDFGVSGAINSGAEKIFFVGFGTGHGRLENPQKYKETYVKQKNKCRL